VLALALAGVFSKHPSGCPLRNKKSLPALLIGGGWGYRDEGPVKKTPETRANSCEKRGRPWASVERNKCVVNVELNRGRESVVDP